MSIKNSLVIQPDPSNLIQRLELDIPLIGFYDSPDTEPFKPTIEPVGKGHNCIFSFYEKWLEGTTLHLTKMKFGCGGAGHWICGIPGRTREEYFEQLCNLGERSFLYKGFWKELKLRRKKA